ncbi:flavo protein [Dunaliella salina]|uniref:phosphopantothenoylcysteine decarboxylase n=1 Tax=Dunaliella salina TaxID=3046 RepID=A0ABQ7H214_DUNSA|nr:flavo protein [Dunaliella salina]|eukprot:KAF5840899.1 flavo protein [Dunaliella salina]
MPDSKQRRPHILLGVTGSVAAIKLPLLCQQLGEIGDLKVITTNAAQHFMTMSAPVPKVEGMEFLNDEDEWHSWQRVGDEVLHIELRRWADIFIIAPLSANSLAKLANGLADNLLTCVARAWDHQAANMLVAPAMNTCMWSGPFTAAHLTTLYDMGMAILPPISKRLACGDTGVGAMAEPASIAEAARALLQLKGGKQLGQQRWWRRLPWPRPKRQLPGGAFQREGICSGPSAHNCFPAVAAALISSAAVLLYAVVRVARQ